MDGNEPITDDSPRKRSERIEQDVPDGLAVDLEQTFEGSIIGRRLITARHLALETPGVRFGGLVESVLAGECDSTSAGPQPHECG